MKMNKNIDRLFQEKLKDFEVSPPENAWANIEAALDKNKKRRLIPLWFRFGSAAAILLLLTFVGIRYFKNHKTTEIENIITDTNENTRPKTLEKTINPTIENIDLKIPKKDKVIITTTGKTKNKTNRKQPDFNSKTKENTPRQLISNANNSSKKNKIRAIEKKTNVIKNTSNNEGIASNKNESNTIKNQKLIDPKVLFIERNNKETAVANTKKTIESQNITSTSKKKKEETLAVANPKIENLEDTLDKNLITETVFKENNTKKWSLTSITGAVVLNSFSGNSSPLDASFNQNKKQKSNTFSYGVKVGYKLSKKWTLQSGVSVVNLSYQTNNINVVTSLNASQLPNIEYTSTALVSSIYSLESDFTSELVDLSTSADSSEIEVNNTLIEAGDLNQKFGYIEVPLEIKYRVIDRKIGVNLVGGFSTLFLNNNSLSVETNNYSSKIGKASNLNKINFSGNFGLDIDYKINQNLFLNIAPMLKIHTNTFSNNPGEFKPYTLGISTGLNYRF